MVVSVRLCGKYRLRGLVVVGSAQTAGIRLIAATMKNIQKLIPLVREFYRHFDYPYDRHHKTVVVRHLIRDRSAGRLWLIEDKGRFVGYVLLAFSFSLEFNGRIAFIDELFVVSTARRKGVGAKALELVEKACVRLGINALRLETEAHNNRATALYLRSGYLDHGRHLMTKELKGSVSRPTSQTAAWGDRRHAQGRSRRVSEQDHEPR